MKVRNVVVCLLAAWVLAGCNRGEPQRPDAYLDLDVKVDPVESAMATPTQSDEAVAPAATALLDAEAIEAAIADMARQDGGSEDVTVREMAEGDLNGDGAPDVAVLYTLEGWGGAHGSIRHLAALVREGGELKLAHTTSVSEYGSSRADIHLSEGAVRFKVLVSDPEDPDAGPTGEEEVTYVLHGGKWLKVQA